MVRLLLLLLVVAYGHGQDLPLNTVWERNDEMLVTLDVIYRNLARPAQNDGTNPQKRSFSIIAEAIVQFLSKNGVLGVEDVVQNTKYVLRQPADVIAADARKDIKYLMSIIDQPINDIKRACRPTTTSMACADRLFYETRLQKRKCSLYDNHVNLRNMTEQLVLSEEFQSLLMGALVESFTGNDVTALAYFGGAVLDYPELFKIMKQLYMGFKFDDYPCMKPGPYEK